MFDTLTYALELKKAGFTEEQATAQAKAFLRIAEDKLVNKQDLALLKTELVAKIDKQGQELTAKIDAQGQEIIAVEDRLTTKIDKQGQELAAKIDAQGQELTAKINAQGQEIIAVEGRLTAKIGQVETKISTIYWVVGLQVALSLVIISKLFNIL